MMQRNNNGFACAEKPSIAFCQLKSKQGGASSSNNDYCAFGRSYEDFKHHSQDEMIPNEDSDRE
jgi:hypothetical protein